MWTRYKTPIHSDKLNEKCTGLVSSEFKMKKEEILLSPMTKALTPTEKSKKQRDNTKTPPKTSEYTTIADQLRTVSWGNDSHPTGVVTGLRTLNLPTNRKSRVIKRTPFLNIS